MPNSITVGQVELTRYVQSTFKVKAGAKVVWVDPVIVNAEQIGRDKADLILVTHEHFDHFSVDCINEASRPGTVLVCNNSGVADKMKGSVKAQITVVKEWDSVDVAGVHLKAAPGYNTYHPRNQKTNSFNVGYIFNLGGQSILHTGDTGLVEEFKDLGPVDIALVPIGGTYTMDETEAAKAIKEMIKPRAMALPMHYGYATGGDPNKFRQLVGKAVKVEVLEPVLKVRYQR
ncbi:MAG: MBL fold metallo-hydrolase [Chloroflexi bacterium]|nr:MBL fold metallo-hydrolase [Chloroflexota bacterium]